MFCFPCNAHKRNKCKMLPLKHKYLDISLHAIQFKSRFDVNIWSLSFIPVSKFKCKTSTTSCEFESFYARINLFHLPSHKFQTSYFYNQVIVTWLCVRDSNLFVHFSGCLCYYYNSPWYNPIFNLLDATCIFISDLGWHLFA